MKKQITYCLALLGFMLLCSANLYAQVVPVQAKVTSIRNGKGKVQLKVYKDSRSYEDNKPYKTFIFDKKGLLNGTLTVNFNLEPGTFGIGMLDDENSDTEMEYNFVRMPKEGFGFSNYFMEKLKKPKFEDFKFNLSKEHNKVEVKVKYL
ncbi:MAG: DUF2141 domain-containing protein [Bacteroidota bacterium]